MTGGGPHDGAPTPPDPLTVLTEAAAQLHEMYASFVRAGFMPDQALALVGNLLTAIMSRTPPPKEPPS